MPIKQLSIIIPTYNMAALLPRCLNSLITAANAELLEAIVVNDGSRDNSLEIAERYRMQYPDVITVIDKPNGNYGSTVNAALPLAKGRYVKILDSDDYFSTAMLDRLLETLRDTEADMVVTPFTEHDPKGQMQVIRYNTMGREPYKYGKLYRLDDILPDGHIRFFLMHALTYRTDLLRSMNYRQTEGISYTDTEWASLPTYYAQTIMFLNYNVYQYNFDRAGQTMDPAVLMKSLGQLEQVLDSIIDYYRLHRDELSAVRRDWEKLYLEGRLKNFYKLYLLDMPRRQFSVQEMSRIDDKYSAACSELGLQVKLYPENKLLRIEYISYWRRHHRRWPVWLEWINRQIDEVARYFYKKFIRNK